MGFKKGNTYGTKTKRGKAKKTIAYESLAKLNDIGITPLETSKKLIDKLVQNNELKNTEQLQLLNTMTNLFKYEMITRAEEIKLDELQNEIEVLQNENNLLKDEFVGDTQDLLRHLQGKNKND